MPADVLAQAEEFPSHRTGPVACRPPVAAKATWTRAGGRAAPDTAQRHGQVARDRLGLDGDRLQRSLPADAARGRRVEAASSRAGSKPVASTSTAFERGRPESGALSAEAPPTGRSRAPAPRRAPVSASSPQPAAPRCGSRAAPRRRARRAAGRPAASAAPPPGSSNRAAPHPRSPPKPSPTSP